ncbi:hypothetical protein AMST5_00055 [freshwater sediment metagenome]|uniref:ParB/Sulfiredoxin domain-containing protein n=1 Tax=freshwater sediment metagenome TaxID=556182 RepID=A0AA48LZV6_9ZZZZ
MLDKDGRILDGRNRYAACTLAGIEPRFVTFDGADPDGYALEINVNRRHMSKGARAMAVAMAHPEAKRGTHSELKNSTGKLGFDKALLSSARLVLRVTPTVAQSVIAGNKPLAAAFEEAKAIEADRAEFNRKLERLKASAQDLALRVTDENLDVDEAIAALELREAKAREEAERARTEADRKAKSARLKAAAPDLKSLLT